LNIKETEKHQLKGIFRFLTGKPLFILLFDENNGEPHKILHYKFARQIT